MTAAIGDAACRVHLPQAKTDGTGNPFGVKCVAYEIPATSDGGGSIIVDLRSTGVTTVYDIWLCEHTTADSVIVTPSTEFESSKTGNNLTITFPSVTLNVKRVAFVWGL